MDTLPENIALLMIIAGPAGSGKSTLCERLIQENENVERVVTCTTRPPREGEVHGVDYYYFSDEEFDQKIEEGAFFEWAKVHANRYGTLRSVIQEKLEQGIDLVMNIDIQGVENFRRAAREGSLIGQRLLTLFVMPSDFDDLRERLRGRGQDDEEEIERRLNTARREVSEWDKFDYAIVSKTRDEDYGAVQSIWQAEKRRVRRLLGLAGR